MTILKLIKLTIFTGFCCGWIVAYKPVFNSKQHTRLLIYHTVRFKPHHAIDKQLLCGFFRSLNRLIALQSIRLCLSFNLVSLRIVIINIQFNLNYADTLKWGSVVYKTGSRLIQNESEAKGSLESFLRYFRSVLNNHLSLVLAMIPVCDGRLRQDWLYCWLGRYLLFLTLAFYPQIYPFYCMSISFDPVRHRVTQRLIWIQTVCTYSR